MESRCDAACIRANTAFRIFRTFGKLVPRLSLNFYSLHGTDDKKIAQTENPYSFLSYYTCSYPSILSFLSSVFLPPLSFSSFSSVYSSWSFFLAHVTTLHLFGFFSSPSVLISPVFYLLIDGSRVNPPESG